MLISTYFNKKISINENDYPVTYEVLLLSPTLLFTSTVYIVYIRVIRSFLHSNFRILGYTMGKELWKSFLFSFVLFYAIINETDKNKHCASNSYDKLSDCKILILQIFFFSEYLKCIFSTVISKY